MMSAVSYRTFATRYANTDATDVFQGAYASVLSKFKSRVGCESNATSTKILEKVFCTANVQPHAYLCLSFAGETLEEAVVTVLHTPFNVTPPMGTSKKTLNLFFHGEVAHDQPPMAVLVPDNAFMATNLVGIPDSVVLDGNIKDPTNLLVGPFREDDAGTTVVTTRCLMYLPPKFIPLGLSQPSFSPREAWEILGNAIRQDALAEGATTTLDEYAPVLTWLSTACTRILSPEGDDNLANTLRDLEVPSPPFPLTPAITAAAQQVVQRDLPGLSQVSAPAVSDSTVQAINQLTNQIQQGQDKEEEYCNAPKVKSPSKYFRKSGDILMGLTRSHTLDSLPPLYLALIGSNKRSERITLDEQLGATADDLGLLQYAPVVTPTMAKKITTFNFAHRNLDDLTGGFHPFLTGYLEPTAHAALDLVRQILHCEQWRPLQAPMTSLKGAKSTPPGGGAPAEQRPLKQLAPPPAVEGWQERVTNVSYDAAFKEFKEKGIPIKTVREAAAAAGRKIPTNSRGTKMCLSYHISGFCFGNCSWHEDHRQHNAAEKAALLEWCKECYREGGPQ